MGEWNMNCRHAPEKQTALHCKKTNEGETKVSKNPGVPTKRSRLRGYVGKGFFGCAHHCRFFEPKNKE